jgi:altronate hydrolase
MTPPEETVTIDNTDFIEPSTGEVPLHKVALRLHPQDHVAIARINLQPGTTLVLGNNDSGSLLRSPIRRVPIRQFIPSGHKVALIELAPGQEVRRYGQIIGFATQPIQSGEHVHTHNLGLQDFARDCAFGVESQPVDYVTASERRTFRGYRRANGQVGTRNYIAVIGTVNCSAHACREIARYFAPGRLAPYPNIDGVIALTHTIGCTMRPDGVDLIVLQRTLAGMARHPNVGAYLLIGLGCETNQTADLVQSYGLSSNGHADDGPLTLAIQDVGGLRKTVATGIAAVESMLPRVNELQRTDEPISELRLALECGGSDSWSGITANPMVGLVADQVVRQGGTVVLSETTEVYGAEHLLTRRAINAEVGQKLVDKVRWWEEYAARHGLEINNNPSPGNKTGGLTNIYEKSLGAVAKGGSTPLMAVYDYAEPVTARGLVFMDTPGYDPISVTGMVAGGCNLVLFTTGRGSVFGFRPAPTLKICTNSATFERMPDDMDLNAGRVLTGLPMQQAADELLNLVIAVASGQPSKSEAQGIGEAEFVPWYLGGTV